MLELATTIKLTGPALPDFYVQHELENKLKGVLPSAARAKETWQPVRAALRQPLTEISGHIRVRNVVVEPLLPIMGYSGSKSGGKVRTREGDEDGGVIYHNDAGNPLRGWTYAYNIDLDAPIARGFTSRYTPQRIAERVLLTTGERVGLLTNGVELRLIISEAARVASSVIVDLNALKQYSATTPPDAFRLIVALASPDGIKRLEEIIDDARLKQSKVTGELRKQAREAVEGLVQGILDHPRNQALLRAELERSMAEKGCDEADAKALLAKRLWREALIVVYRLLFILSGEAGTRERQPFSFASVSLWRNTYSPSTTLGRLAVEVIKGMDSGRFLEDGLRALFRFFESGISSTELNIAPLGGVLFGVDAAPLIDALAWSEHGCAVLLDKLLRAPRGKGKAKTLVRLSYRDLDVEELGRVYEALLELDPGITSEDMVRLRRQKLEVVVPYAQGEKYRAAAAVDDEDDADEPEVDEDDDSGKKGKIKWIEAIDAPNEAHPIGRFYLRVGLGRKSSGSYYTPESFVKFLVQETLTPQCDALSPADDPQPRAILTLNVLDPSMGSGHFLVGACRFLGDRVYDACRRAAELDQWERVPEEVTAYLPGRVLEGASEAGLSAERARAICKRLVAVNCLYGVDKNPLAVELARVALWLESFAEGLPLTFLNHRLVQGDSLLGAIKIAEGGHDSPLQAPYADTPQELIRVQEVRERLKDRLREALALVRELDSTIGVNAADIAHKAAVKAQLDAELRPFVLLCTAWSGGIMLGAEQADQAGYIDALRMFAMGEWDEDALSPGFLKMLAKGQDAAVLTYPLAFPEVFFPDGDPAQMRGFDAVVGNPPWDRVRPFAKDFYASYNFEIVAAATKRERDEVERQLDSKPAVRAAFEAYRADFDQQGIVHDVLYEWQSVRIGDVWAGRGNADAYALFAERSLQLQPEGGSIGLVLPSGFYANEGSTGIRQLFLWNTVIRQCFSFENRRKLFEIDSRFKFGLLVAHKNSMGSGNFLVAFYLHDESWLFASIRDRQPLVYSRQFVERTGGDYLSFLELLSDVDVQVAEQCFATSSPLSQVCDQLGVITGVQADMTRDKWRFTDTHAIVADRIDPRDPDNTRQLVSSGFLLLHEGKTFHHYTDHWVDRPDYLVSVANLNDKHGWIEEACFYRLAYRSVASSTNERTVIFSLLPPATVAGNSAPIERRPKDRPNAYALMLIGVTNSFVFDWSTRLRVGANINQFILFSSPVPQLEGLSVFLAHAALRLVCNHEGYFPLWQEQLGDVWREPKPKYTFPVLDEDAERWEVRAAIDAVVAQAYGLNRDQYEHVLHSFDRASRINPHTDLCLAKWDELHAIGLEAFTRQYDPYHDIPLVETLPKPVIDLKLPSPPHPEGEGTGVRDDVPRDLFGEPLPTNLFGEVIDPSVKRKKRR